MKKAPGVAALESSEALGAKLDQLEQRLDRLRAQYDTFFLGLDRRPPEAPRAELNRLFLDMQKTSIRNAALRFRFQTLQQRWATHVTQWNRILREMESGTYRPDMERAGRRMARRGERLTAQDAVAMGIPSSRAQAFVERHNQEAAKGTSPSAPEAGAAPSAGPETKAASSAFPAAEPGTLRDDDIKRLLTQWRLADQKLGRADSSPPPEKLRQQLAAQIPKILSSRGGSKVEFDVATKDGKVVIRVKGTS